MKYHPAHHRSRKIILFELWRFRSQDRPTATNGAPRETRTIAYDCHSGARPTADRAGTTSRYHAGGISSERLFLYTFERDNVWVVGSLCTRVILRNTRRRVPQSSVILLRGISCSTSVTFAQHRNHTEQSRITRVVR